MVDERERDRELARLFDELRQADELRVPPFRRVLERRAAPRAGLVRWAPPAAAAAFLAVVLFLARPAFMHRERPVPTSTVAALAEWRSPTDFLLETPGSELLETAPDLATTAPEWATGGAPPASAAPRRTPSPSRSNPLEKGATS